MKEQIIKNLNQYIIYNDDLIKVISFPKNTSWEELILFPDGNYLFALSMPGGFLSGTIAGLLIFGAGTIVVKGTIKGVEWVVDYINKPTSPSPKKSTSKDGDPKESTSKNENNNKK